jgi:hypothetical protein
MLNENMQQKWFSARLLSADNGRGNIAARGGYACSRQPRRS